MRRARLCFVEGSAEMFLCCSMTIGELGSVGVIEQAARARVVKIVEKMIFAFIAFSLG